MLSSPWHGRRGTSGSLRSSRRRGAASAAARPTCAQGRFVASAQQSRIHSIAERLRVLVWLDGKRRGRYPSALIVPQDAAGAVVQIIGARRARARPLGQVRAGCDVRSAGWIIAQIVPARPGALQACCAKYKQAGAHLLPCCWLSLSRSNVGPSGTAQNTQHEEVNPCIHPTLCTQPKQQRFKLPKHRR